MNSQPIEVAEVERRVAAAFRAKGQLINVEQREPAIEARQSWRRLWLPVAAATVILALLGAYLLGGPARRDGGALPTVPTAGTTVDPLKPASHLAAALDRARPVHVTSAEPGGPIASMPWHFLALLDGGETLLISYEIGDSCERSRGIHLQQGSNAIELTALSLVYHRGLCEQYSRVAFGIVHLDAPLGHRLLLHAPTS